MTDSLRNFAQLNDNQEIEINGTLLVPRLEGETCWERQHPTFISKKRKVILTCPRKVGHSSIRFYFNSQNEMYDDDWVWIEDHNRDPKTWLDDDEYKDFIEDVYSNNNRAVLICGDADYEKSNNPVLMNAEILKINSSETKKHLGDYNAWDYGSEVASKLYNDKQKELSPPFQTLSYFKDWTTYLVVRDPWERFISGLITEMDNGINSPWPYEKGVDTEKGWEKFYNSAKRMLYFSDPEWLLLGGLDGQQMNHTFLLSRPMWKGKTMYDSYDNFIHYKHEIDYALTDNGDMHVSTDSFKKSAGVIEFLIQLDFIYPEVKEKHLGQDYQNSYGHTHMNITPHIRQHVISELQEDEDLKEWWDKCRKIVDWDYESLKINQHKF